MTTRRNAARASGARAAGTGERLEKKSRYDFVVVGGGPNGLGIAAYLSKWGFSVCMLEARPEIGGGAENTEPEPGFSIDPHASFFYGSMGPGPEQLELGKYGFRLSNSTGSASFTSDGRKTIIDNTGMFEGVAFEDLPKFVESLGGSSDGSKFFIEFMVNLQARVQELVRSIYWTPAYDHKWRIPKDELPESRIFKDIVPIWDDAYLDMSLYEFLNSFDLPDPMMCGALINAWGNGPHPYYKGMLIPAFGVGLLLGTTLPSPVGGMHALAHALARCTLAHGGKIFVNSPVSEIIVEDGRAVGVRVDDESVLEEKTIWANMAVIADTHVKQLPKLVSPGALTPDLTAKINDVSLKGGSLWVMNMLVNELPQFTQAPHLNQPGNMEPTVYVLNAETDKLLELMRDVQTFRTHPTELDHYGGLWFIVQGTHDRTRVRPGDGRHIIYHNLQVPAPEEHRDGPEAVNRARDEIVDNIKTVIRQYAPNMTDDKYDKIWVNTPYDSSMRNMAFVGGQWMGMRESEQEWGGNKPVPELARYRTPIDGLYLCHQTSHPGGLCLIAVPYNLMHILHEDYPEVAQSTPDWWYPSPYHISDADGRRGKSPGEFFA